MLKFPFFKTMYAYQFNEVSPYIELFLGFFFIQEATIKINALFFSRTCDLEARMGERVQRFQGSTQTTSENTFSSESHESDSEENQ